MAASEDLAETPPRGDQEQIFQQEAKLPVLTPVSSPRATLPSCRGEANRSKRRAVDTAV